MCVCRAHDGQTRNPELVAAGSVTAGEWQILHWLYPYGMPEANDQESYDATIAREAARLFGKLDVDHVRPAKTLPVMSGLVMEMH